MRKQIAILKKKYEVFMFCIVPLIDCLLLLPIFLLFVNVPVQAIPFDLSTGHYPFWNGKFIGPQTLCHSLN